MLPIESNEEVSQTLVNELEEALMAKLLQTEEIRFLSSNAIASRPQNPFPYLSTEFGAEWIIEGSIRKRDSAVRISLSLVEAQTALVVYSSNKDIEPNVGEIEKFCDEFLLSIHVIVNADG